MASVVLPRIGGTDNEEDNQFKNLRRIKGPNVPPPASRLATRERYSICLPECDQKTLPELAVSGVVQQNCLENLGYEDHNHNTLDELNFVNDHHGCNFEIPSISDAFSMLQIKGFASDKYEEGTTDENYFVEQELATETRNEIINLDSVQWNDFSDKDQLENNLNQLLSCKKLILKLDVARFDYVPGIIAIPIFHCPRCLELWKHSQNVPDYCVEDAEPTRGNPISLDQTASHALLKGNKVNYIKFRGRKRTQVNHSSGSRRRKTIMMAFHSDEEKLSEIYGKESSHGVREYGGLDASEARLLVSSSLDEVLETDGKKFSNTRLMRNQSGVSLYSEDKFGGKARIREESKQMTDRLDSTKKYFRTKAENFSGEEQKTFAEYDVNMRNKTEKNLRAKQKLGKKNSLDRILRGSSADKNVRFKANDIDTSYTKNNFRNEMEFGGSEEGSLYQKDQALDMPHTPHERITNPLKKKGATLQDCSELCPSTNKTATDIFNPSVNVEDEKTAQEEVAGAMIGNKRNLVSIDETRALTNTATDKASQRKNTELKLASDSEMFDQMNKYGRRSSTKNPGVWKKASIPEKRKKSVVKHVMATSGGGGIQQVVDEKTQSLNASMSRRSSIPISTNDQYVMQGGKQEIQQRRSSNAGSSVTGGVYDSSNNLRMGYMQSKFSVDSAFESKSSEFLGDDRGASPDGRRNMTSQRIRLRRGLVNKKEQKTDSRENKTDHGLPPVELLKSAASKTTSSSHILPLRLSDSSQPRLHAGCLDDYKFIENNRLQANTIDNEVESFDRPLKKKNIFDKKVLTKRENPADGLVSLPPEALSIPSPSPSISRKISRSELYCLNMMKFTSTFTFSFYDLPEQYRKQNERIRGKINKNKQSERIRTRK